MIRILADALISTLAFMAFHVVERVVLGLIRGSFTPVAEPGEVEEVFRVPFAHIADPASYRIERRRWRGTWRSYYVAPWGPYYIWGATARVLHALALRLNA